MKRKIVFSESKQAFNVRFGEAGQTFNVSFGEVQPITEYIGGDPYDGECVITPNFDTQTLPTAGKVMLDDVTVKKIPVTKVSNTSGGNTVIIGG